MIAITNEFEANDMPFEPTFNDETDYWADMADAYDDEQAGEQEEDNDEGDPDALGTLVYENESLYDAPHNFVESKVEQSTIEEEKVEESAKEDAIEEDETLIESPSSAEEDKEDDVPPFEVPTFMSFHDTMRMWIEILAKTDEDIAKNIKKENKSYKECADYILNYVSSHRGGLSSVVTTSDALLPLVKHYYEDDNCKAETTPKSIVASASTAPPRLQNTLDKVADKINKGKKPKKKTKAEQKKEEHDKKIAIGASLELPNTTKARTKVFSGYKKGSNEYNKAIEEQSQLSLFD